MWRICIIITFLLLACGWFRLKLAPFVVGCSSSGCNTNALQFKCCESKLKKEPILCQLPNHKKMSTFYRWTRTKLLQEPIIAVRVLSGKTSKWHPSIELIQTYSLWRSIYLKGKGMMNILLLDLCCCFIDGEKSLCLIPAVRNDLCCLDVTEKCSCFAAVLWFASKLLTRMCFSSLI